MSREHDYRLSEAMRDLERGELSKALSGIGNTLVTQKAKDVERYLIDQGLLTNHCVAQLTQQDLEDAGLLKFPAKHVLRYINEADPAAAIAAHPANPNSTLGGCILQQEVKAPGYDKLVVKKKGKRVPVRDANDWCTNIEDDLAGVCETLQHHVGQLRADPHNHTIPDLEEDKIIGSDADLWLLKRFNSATDATVRSYVKKSTRERNSGVLSIQDVMQRIIPAPADVLLQEAIIQKFKQCKGIRNPDALHKLEAQLVLWEEMYSEVGEVSTVKPQHILVSLENFLSHKAFTTLPTK